MAKTIVQFTLIENSESTIIKTDVDAYKNLMELLKNELCLDDFGVCGGMGRCATCIVKTHKITGNSKIKERNEPATLFKNGYTEDNIRLACQLMITEDLNNAIIELLHQ